MTNQTAIQIREIRVFLSSTFRDMDVERTYLIKQVFPKVRAACLERQVGFSEIDLRWGVSEEEAKNGATVEICLKEIDRCRDFPPFFVGFLGERYGWVPKHDDLAAYWDKHSDSEYAPAIRRAIEREISVTELEMELAVLGDGAAEKMAGHALFCLRDSKLTDAIYAEAKASNHNTRDVDFYDAGQGKLKALKHKIKKSGYLDLDNYTSVEQFGAAVETYLLAQLDRYFPADAVPTHLERSNAAHAGFRFHRLQNFLPRIDVREAMIQAIVQRIEAPSLGPILVTGPSGQGKSALMADLARHYQTTKVKAANKKETWRVFDHYIGADSANHLDAWVDRILQTLHPEIKDIAGDIPDSPKDKIEALSTWISMAARRNHCRYLFILDALDQLNDGGKNLDILTPQVLGPDGIVIASAADGTRARTSTANWQTPIEVPPLTNALRTKIVTDTLARYRKRLPEDLASKLAHAPQSGSPLFLGLALEELRLDARHETLAQLIHDILKQPDAEHLFLNNFLLDDDYGRPEMPELAACFMALLGASRAGLSENELADLLAMPDDPIAEDTGKPRLPQIHLSRLLNNLAPFLLNKQGRRAPMHRIFGESALKYFGTASVREHLYAHFALGYGKGKNEYKARGAAEALHQITELTKFEHPKQKQAQKQLVADLGYLPIPVELHDDETNDGEKLVLAGIDWLDEAEQQQLNKLWGKVIGKLDASVAENVGAIYCDFGIWLKHWSCYSLALAVLEPILNKQVQLLPPDHLDIGTSSNSLGALYLDLARYQEAMPLFRHALAIHESQLGVDHPDTAICLSNLAELLRVQGDYAGAEPLFRRALSILENKLGAEHLTTSSCLINLGSLLQAQGGYAGAEPLFRRALAICESQLGAEHLTTSSCLINLGSLLRDMGNYAGAEPLFQRALATRESQLGSEHPATATSLHNLALMLSDMGNYTEAEQLYRRSLAIRESQLGAEHPSTANSLNNLAGLLQEKGDYAGVMPLYRRALAIHERQLGVDHPDTAICLSNLAELLRVQGDYAGAEPLFRRALSILENKLGAEHFTTSGCLINLGSLLQAQGGYAGAEPLFRRALAICESQLGAEHPTTANSLNNLASLLEDMGDYVGAEPLYRRALAIRESQLGAEHPDIGTSLNNLAALLQGQGDYAGAMPLYRRSLAIRESQLGTEHPEIAKHLGNLAGLIKDKGDYEEAGALYRRALAISESQLGGEHPDTATGLNNLALLLKDQGDYTGAEPLYRRALAIRENQLGGEDPSTVRSINNLAGLLRAKGDYAGAESLYRRALAIRENVYGENSSQAGPALYSLGCILGLMGRLDEAEVMLRRELEIASELSGEEDEGTLRSIDNLAELLEEKKDIEASAAMRFKQLAILEKITGKEHENTLTVLQNLAVLLRNAGKLDEAEPLQRESVARHINVYGEDGLQTAAAYSGLGALLKLKGELVEAQIYYRKALAIRERELGGDAEPTKLMRKRLEELLA